MITEKFVKIARDILSFTKKGYKIQFGTMRLDLESNSVDILRIACIINNYSVNEISSTEAYTFAENYYNVTREFIHSFDEGCIFYDEEYCNFRSEDHELGIKLSKMLYKRGLISKQNC